MKIFYQWAPWAYSHKASMEFSKKFNLDKLEIEWVSSFKDVFLKIDNWNIWVLPIENSYAWSIHENFYHIIAWNYKIIWEYYLAVNHSLLANTNDISKIKEVYSHPQALMQCSMYLKEKWIQDVNYHDTAFAAKFVKESFRDDIAAIASSLAWEIYWLNSLDEWINDQIWNTTRFLLIVKESIYKDFSSYILQRNKVSILFKTKDIPRALYKCLGAFATRSINLLKIESLPAKANKFEYIFLDRFWKKTKWKKYNRSNRRTEIFLKRFKNTLRILNKK